MKNPIKFLTFATILLVLLGSCSRLDSSTSIVTPNENKLQDIAKIDLSLEKLDKREGLKEIDIAKSYADVERYFRLASSWERLRCEPASGFVCTKHECRKIEPTSYLILDKKAKIIKRCDKEVCEELKGEFTQIGVFVNIQSSGGFGNLIRILGDSRYKEVSAIGLDAYISNGKCASLPRATK